MNIPQEAIDAAESAIQYSAPDGDARSAAEEALRAALPHLFPGLFVTRDDDGTVIWAENPDRPHLPEALLARTAANARLFDAVAALLPERGEEGEDCPECHGLGSVPIMTDGEPDGEACSSCSAIPDGSTSTDGTEPF